MYKIEKQYNILHLYDLYSQLLELNYSKYENPTLMHFGVPVETTIKDGFVWLYPKTIYVGYKNHRYHLTSRGIYISKNLILKDELDSIKDMTIEELVLSYGRSAIVDDNVYFFFKNYLKVIKSKNSI